VTELSRRAGRTRRRAGWGRWPAALAALVALAVLAALSLAGCDATRLAPPGEAEAAGSPESARIARDATWSPGQLQAHFAKHGRAGGHASAQAYDASARETVRTGREFSYVDRTAQARRRGYYDPPTNRFTSVTEDGKRITTHFRPDTGERYVRGLGESTYK
jgi:pyocin large subunit-like protein